MNSPSSPSSLSSLSSCQNLRGSWRFLRGFQRIFAFATAAVGVAAVRAAAVVGAMIGTGVMRVATGVGTAGVGAAEAGTAGVAVVLDVSRELFFRRGGMWWWKWRWWRWGWFSNRVACLFIYVFVWGNPRTCWRAALLSPWWKSPKGNCH